jgi:hypothetical protein
MFLKLICAGMILTSMSSLAATNYVFTGTFHNDRKRHRATIETDTGRYLLDFRGVDLHHVSERHDRENVVVEGDIDYYAPSNGDYQVLRVNKITFRPFNGRAITYSIGSTRYYSDPAEHYTTYERPVYREPIRERRVIRRYYYR